MNRKDKAISYFRAGYNCAQSMVLACAGENDNAALSAAAFGGGIGRMQKICGAVTGAYIYLGIANGINAIPSDEDKVKVYSKVRRFNDLFIERNGTDQCSELLGVDMNTPEGKEKIHSGGLHESVCEKCICDAMDILDEIG